MPFPDHTPAARPARVTPQAPAARRRAGAVTASLLLVTGLALAPRPALGSTNGPTGSAGSSPAYETRSTPLTGTGTSGAATGLILRASALQDGWDEAERARRQQAEEAARRRAESLARASRKAAADRAERVRRAGLLAASWTTPVTGYALGAGYGIGGRLWARTHSGQDFVVPTGTPVRAAHGGTVVEAGWGGAYGWNIVVRHASGLYTQYGHLSRLGVGVGRSVRTGEVIGRSGSTGNSTGPHLHFEVRTAPWYGSSVAPLPFLRSRGVRP
ncbi:M23 family metallopeptidase [Streptomyces sp. NPDC001941]|uniref:M23 family metallopeptidase n=1 Tax=Streptomyces sp. NPDC001941 TaxID=3154659 RepID=UPI0033277503